MSLNDILRQRLSFPRLPKRSETETAVSAWIASTAEPTVVTPETWAALLSRLRLSGGDLSRFEPREQRVILASLFQGPEPVAQDFTLLQRLLATAPTSRAHRRAAFYSLLDGYDFGNAALLLSHWLRSHGDVDRLQPDGLTLLERPDKVRWALWKALGEGRFAEDASLICANPSLRDRIISSPAMTWVLGLPFQAEEIRMQGSLLKQIQTLIPDGLLRRAGLEKTRQKAVTSVVDLLVDWADQGPQSRQKDVVDQLLKWLGDPRASPLNWQAVSERSRHLILQWLSLQTLEQFVRIMDRIGLDANGRRMWEERRTFWMRYRSHFRGAWLACGSRAQPVARAAGVESFGELRRQGIADGLHCALVLQVANLLCMVVNFSAPLLIWRVETPGLYGPIEERYDRGRLRAHIETYRPDGARVVIQRQDWQEEVAQHLADMGIVPQI